MNPKKQKSRTRLKTLQVELGKMRGRDKIKKRWRISIHHLKMKKVRNFLAMGHATLKDMLRKGGIFC